MLIRNGGSRLDSCVTYSTLSSGNNAKSAGKIIKKARLQVDGESLPEFGKNTELVSKSSPGSMTAKGQRETLSVTAAKEGDPLPESPQGFVTAEAAQTPAVLLKWLVQTWSPQEWEAQLPAG